jgi:hypothetical protein
MQQRLQANVSRFAAYKAYRVTQTIERQRADFDGVERSGEAYRTAAKAVINAYNRYQVTEFNTIQSRTRTAKQWTDFTSDPENNELFPNMEWLPSRSANPREQHIPFYGLVLPKSDPFWQQNQPGNLWNCKCDWEPTDKPVTTGKRPEVLPARGLEGNPAETGEIFSDNASYFQGDNRRANEFFAPIAAGHRDFLHYIKDPDYNDTRFNWDNGGMMTTHKKHNFDPTPTSFDKSISRGSYERESANVLFKNGHRVILKSELGADGVSTPDGILDESVFEIKGIEGTGKRNIRDKLFEASKQGCETVVLYYPNASFFSITRLNAQYHDYLKSSKNHRIKKILYINAGKLYRYK